VKNVDETFSRFDTIPACDGQTDGQTSCDSIVPAMHTYRAVTNWFVTVVADHLRHVAVRRIEAYLINCVPAAIGYVCVSTLYAS